MPDHLHALVIGLAKWSDARRFVRVAKQQTAYHFKQAHGAQLWQRSFFDRTLRADEDTRDVIRYIVSNPVLAGLVASPCAYEFWGSQVYTRQQILEFVQDGTHART